MRALTVRPGSGHPRVEDVPEPDAVSALAQEHDVELVVELQTPRGGSSS